MVLLNNEVVPLDCINIVSAGCDASIIIVDTAKSWKERQRGRHTNNEIRIDLFVNLT